MGPIGAQEMVIIFLVALVLFGPKKLPELGRTIGRAITEFRRAQNELKATLQHHMGELERESESIRELTSSLNNTIYSNYYDSRHYGSSSWEQPSNTYAPPPAIEASTASVSAPEDAHSNPPSEANEAPLSVNGTVPRGAPGSAEPGPPEAQPDSPAEGSPLKS
jgi:sec-independent protein translocase protein TatA